MTNNQTNPFGSYGDAIEPRKPKKKRVSAHAVVTLQISPLDNSEWAERLTKVDKAVNAITQHVNQNKEVKFIKRKFFLNAVENHLVSQAPTVKSVGST